MKSKLSKSLKAYGIEKYKFKKSYNTLQLIKKEISENYTAELEVQSLSDLDFSKYANFASLPKCNEYLDELCA